MRINKKNIIPFINDTTGFISMRQFRKRRSCKPKAYTIIKLQIHIYTHIETYVLINSEINMLKISLSDYYFLVGEVYLC